jgi:hypothetical protein
LSKIRAGSRLSGPLWIKESAAELRVLELAALHFRGVPEDSSVLSAFTESIDISVGCQWIFSILFSAPCSTKFERSVPKHNACAHEVLVGNFAQERNFLSPCNGLFALEGVSFATGLPA